MTLYRNVLLAADLIDQDDHPVSKKAHQIASSTGAQLSIIHVVEYPFYYGMPYDTPALAEWQQEVEETAKKTFDSLCSRLGVPAERAYLVAGQAKTLILETAEKIEADLIVLGSHGRHGIGLLLMGSTATAVIHGAKCDVLAIRVDTPTFKS